MPGALAWQQYLSLSLKKDCQNGAAEVREFDDGGMFLSPLVRGEADLRMTVKPEHSEYHLFHVPEDIDTNNVFCFELLAASDGSLLLESQKLHIAYADSRHTSR